MNECIKKKNLIQIKKIQVILRFLINILKVIKLNKKDESDLDFMRIKGNLNYFDQYQNVS